MTDTYRLRSAKRGIFLLVMLYFLAVSLAGVCSAREESGDDRLIKEIAAMNLEELLDTKVTLGARTPEQWFNSASAIYVITDEDIRRSGMTEVPELLRMVPGVHVARIDAGVWAISIRGFNGRFSSMLLVLVDGRIAYTPLFSGVYWDVQDLMIEDIDRIEVIRGPGAALWGSNAVNGVINIITRQASDTRGGLVSGTAGDKTTLYQTAARYGFGLDNFHFRAYGKYSEHYPGEFLGEDLSKNRGYVTPGAEAHDGWRQWHAGFRADWDVTSKDRVSFFGDIHDGEFGKTRVVSSMPITADKDTTFASGGYFIASWQRKFSNRSDVKLCLYYDHTRRYDAALDETRDTYTADFQHRYAIGRHDLMWGVERRGTKDELVSSSVIFFDPAERTLNRTTAFVQDRIGFGADRTVSLTVGSKFEHNNFTGDEYQPSVRLLWSPSDTMTFWASVSRAVRIPSRADSDMNIEIMPGFSIPIGNPDLDSEEVVAFELGGRYSISRRFFVDLTGFLNDYRKLVVNTANDGTARAAGFEVASRWQGTRFWTLQASYSFIDFIRQEPAAVSYRPPRQMANVRSCLNLPASFEFDASAYYVDPSFNFMPKYTRVDLRLGWSLSSHLEAEAAIRNLFDASHAEAPEGTRLNTAVPRSAHLTARVRF